MHPQVVDAYLDGFFPKLVDRFRPARRKNFSRAEQFLLHVLDETA